VKRLVLIAVAVPVISRAHFPAHGADALEVVQTCRAVGWRSGIVASNASRSRLRCLGAPGGSEPRALGVTILRGYADTNLPPENDLTLMSRLMENSLLLLKSAANRPLSANEDWADLFRGKNGAREEFLPAQHVALNDKGQLIDRWQTPLFFHALGGGRYEIRSAGPDKTMWTADDLQRNSNGTFLRETNGVSRPGR
jgi:hypothetical protein